MILKDMYCCTCNTVVTDVEVQSAAVVAINMLCVECRQGRYHRTICNGGTGKRYRFADWNLDDVRKGIRYTKGGACYGGADGQPDKSRPITDNVTGEIYQNAERFSAEAIDEKRSRLNHQRDTRMGRSKIITHSRATSAQGSNK